MRIGVDMDGVLVDFTSAALRQTKKIWGLDIKYKDLKEPKIGDYIYDLLDEETKKRYSCRRDIYEELVTPGFFQNLEPYPGAVEAFKKLDEIHDLVVITKPLGWTTCPGEKINWLEKNLGHIPKIAMVNSHPVKGMFDVDIMIDDDPRVIKSLSTAIGLVVRHPWNEAFLRLEGVNSIGSFAEAPDVVDSIYEMYYRPLTEY